MNFMYNFKHKHFNYDESIEMDYFSITIKWNFAFHTFIYVYVFI